MFQKATRNWSYLHNARITPLLNAIIMYAFAADIIE